MRPRRTASRPLGPPTAAVCRRWGSGGLPGRRERAPPAACVWRAERLQRGAPTEVGGGPGNGSSGEWASGRAGGWVGEAGGGGQRVTQERPPPPKDPAPVPMPPPPSQTAHLNAGVPKSPPPPLYKLRP